MIHSRRQFLHNFILTAMSLIMKPTAFAAQTYPEKRTAQPICDLFRAVNGSPSENMKKVIELMGGIENLFGRDDVVVIKPNVQWWNQGAPNLLALKTFVELIMNRPGGFTGEVVIAENCHRGPKPWESAGWVHAFERNSDLNNITNMSELGSNLKKKYGAQYSTCYWINVSNGKKRIYSPADGEGYVYCDGTGGVPLLAYSNGVAGKENREVIMTYPIFRTDNDTIIDLKNGIWKYSAYTKQPLRFVNFAALNHHSTYCGATSAIKNYLGVSDLSGGPDPSKDGKLTDKYYNFHSFPYNKWEPGPEPGMLGAEIGMYLRTIRKADLNITTAEWIGLADRIDPPVVRTKAVIACTDPVALDYHTTKYLLYPNSKISVHDPDNKKGPLCQYLMKCGKEGGGIYNEEKVSVKSFDFMKQIFQEDKNLYITGKKLWGFKPKSIMKYIYMRYLLN